jgi:4-amino-4-deoxy-L-arabinose transferase-like glycosyltransferase
MLSRIVSTHGRWTLAILAAILLLGFALRADRALHPVDHPGDDAQAYFSLSKSLYVDGTYGGPTFESPNDWSPGAPLLYAGVYYATGGVRDGAARMLVALLGTISIAVIYLLGRRISCRPAGLLAAAGAAVYPSFIHTNGALLSEPPAILTLPAAVLAFLWADERGSPWAWIAPGLLFGVTALIRPEYLLVGAAMVVIALVRRWRGGGWRPGAAAAAVLLAAFLVPIVPWTIRNIVTLDRFVPISTGGGKALYVGTYLPGDGDYQRVKALLVERYLHRNLEPGSAALDRVDPVPLFNRVADRYPNLERDAALQKIGKDNLWHYLGDDPLGYAGMLARKVGRMWGTGVGPAMDTTAGRAAQRLLLLLALGGFAVLAWRRRWFEVIVFAVPIGVITAVGAITLASNRRNEILMTLVLPLAATALARTGAWARERWSRRSRAGGTPEAHAPAHS